MKHWKSVILALGCFLLTCWSLTSIALSYDGEVLLLNAATEAIKNGELDVCDQKFPFGGIDQGKSKLLRYDVRSDSQYKLVVEFDSGKTLTSELGSVTSEVDFKDILTVTDHDVSLTRLLGK
jgi:hypothetical protein